MAGLGLEQQTRELVRYLSTPEGRAAFLSFDRRELAAMLAPRAAQPQEVELFRNDLNTVVQSLSQRPAAGAVEPEMARQIA